MAEPRRIVLLRHGRTEWNASHRIQGQLDVDLDETGIEQARDVAPVIAGLGPSVLWSSDLVRARLTAEQVAKESGLSPSYDKRLREFYLGDYQGLTHAELAARSEQDFRIFRTGAWDAIPGGERIADVAQRYVAALEDLAAELAPGETGVAVSHGAAIRVGVVAFLGWPLESALDLRGLDNCARVELCERESGAWALSAYNLTA
ncbi:MAG TPA: histidine phosphatase family protein [Nocardioides sp.]|nr:histidine phosphatase family protein [Nocardioides sp.]